MARYTETFDTDKSYDEAWDASRRVLLTPTWSITGVQNNTFFIRERIGLIDMFFRNSCRFALVVERQDDHRTSLMIWGATFGFGPLPKARLRRTAAVLKGQLLAELAKPSEAA